jgi:hypothetical protein
LKCAASGAAVASNRSAIQGRPESQKVPPDSTAFHPGYKIVALGEIFNTQMYMTSDGPKRQTSIARATRVRWTAILPYLPSVLLFVTALCQFILASTVDLSPWLGGGFGMFSTTDDGINRQVRVFMTQAGEKEQKREIPESLTDLAHRARVLPSPGRLQAFAHALAHAYWREGWQFSTLRVEVWRTTFDPQSLTPHARKLRECVLTTERETE